MTKEETVPQVAAPKRPLSAFFLYKGEKYAQTAAQNPEMKIQTITQVISKQWQDEPNEVKDQYRARYLTAKEAFDKEMKDHIEKHGKPPKRQKKVRKVKKAKKVNKVKKVKKVKKPKEKKAEVPKTEIPTIAATIIPTNGLVENNS